MDAVERVTTTDTLASDAVGGEHLGKKYYLSPRFMGTVFGTSLSLCSAYAAYLLPVGILSYINADIGMSVQALDTENSFAHNSCQVPIRTMCGFQSFGPSASLYHTRLWADCLTFSVDAISSSEGISWV